MAITATIRLLTRSTYERYTLNQSLCIFLRRGHFKNHARLRL